MRDLMLLSALIASVGSSPNQDSFGDPYGQDYFGALAGPLQFHFSPAQLANIRAQQQAAMAGQHPALAMAPARNTGATSAAALGLHPAALAGLGYALPNLPASVPRPAGRMTTDAVYWGVDSGSVAIAAGASATITVRPQQRCVPISMSLVEPVAENFLITSILVGVMPILVTTGAISPAIFVQNSTAPTFKRYMLEVGTDFSVGVTNITAAGARFSATAIGENHAADAN